MHTVYHRRVHSPTGKPVVLCLRPHRGLDAYWADAVVNFPNLTYQKQKEYAQVDQMMLSSFPIYQATQERFNYFKQAIANHLTNEAVILSVPSGLLPEFVALCDTLIAKKVRIEACDMDLESLHLLKMRLEKRP